MLNILKVRINQGYQAIRDIGKARISEPFRGLPLIRKKNCPQDSCSQCIESCPAKAISKSPLSIDLGKCIFCGDCQRICPEGIIRFSQYHKIASDSRDYLIVTNDTSSADYERYAFSVRKEIHKLFRHSLKLRSVSAGGCNACEMELNACTNVNFDMGRFGIDIVASPRHADGIVITGPITENMAAALEDTYRATPGPKIIIVAGTCAISGGLFADSAAIQRSFLEKNRIDLYIPGCPIHPLTFVQGVVDFLGISPS